MQFRFVKSGNLFEADLDKSVSIAIALDFDGQQPSHFGAPPATAKAMRAGDFVGRVAEGGSCNVDVVTINLHCNGTHTETVGHIVQQSVPVANMTQQPVVACLVSIDPVSAAKTDDSYRPELAVDDFVIDRNSLESNPTVRQFANLSSALVVRTLPNPQQKKFLKHGQDGIPPFFTTDAIEFVNQKQIHHLVVDFPSIDRMYDDGKLTNHHVYWGVEEGTSTIENPDSIKTVTEMVFVPDSVEDGLYLLNLQVPAFETDAAPSRPILYPLRLLNDD